MRILKNKTMTFRQKISASALGIYVLMTLCIEVFVIDGEPTKYTSDFGHFLTLILFSALYFIFLWLIIDSFLNDKD